MKSKPAHKFNKSSSYLVETAQGSKHCKFIKKEYHSKPISLKAQRNLRAFGHRLAGDPELYPDYFRFINDEYEQGYIVMRNNGDADGR